MECKKRNSSRGSIEEDELEKYIRDRKEVKREKDKENRRMF